MSTNELKSGHSNGNRVVMICSTRFLFGCALVAVTLLVVGRVMALPLWLLAAEVFATILGLFLFGSFKYQIHKNALTYGMALVDCGDFLRPGRLAMASRNR